MNAVVLYLLGFTVMMATAKRQRLGDLAGPHYRRARVRQIPTTLAAADPRALAAKYAEHSAPPALREEAQDGCYAGITRRAGHLFAVVVVANPACRMCGPYASTSSGTLRFRP